MKWNRKCIEKEKWVNYKVIDVVHNLQVKLWLLTLSKVNEIFDMFVDKLSFKYFAPFSARSTNIYLEE